MSSESISFTINARTARRASLHGREHLVVPTVLIVPGVLNGSRGPLLYEARDVAASTDAWNGMPVVVYHPQSGATSARSPQVSDKQKVGEIYNARIDKGRLVADVWIDVARAQKVDRRVLDSVESGRPLEVSTGLLVDQVPARNGSHLNGKAYWSIARNFRPDHLAILPDQVGACSLKDGCGMLVNSARPVIPRVVNAAPQGANCGTGSGGFKRGNKCASGGGGAFGGPAARAAKAVPSDYKRPSTVLEVQQDLDRFMSKGIVSGYDIGPDGMGSTYVPGNKHLSVRLKWSDTYESDKATVEEIAKRMAIRVKVSEATAKTWTEDFHADPIPRAQPPTPRIPIRPQSSVRNGVVTANYNSARPVIPRVVNAALVANCDGDKTCKACAAKKRKKWVPMNNVRDPKVGRCVDDVVKTGKDKVAAIRICQASVGRAYHPKGG